MYAEVAAFGLPSRAAIVATPIKASTLFGSSSSAAKYSACAFATLPAPSARYPACTCRSIGDAPSDRVTESVAIAARVAARRGKNWAESDRLRDVLSVLGVAIKDNKDGTTSWEPKR